MSTQLTTNEIRVLAELHGNIEEKEGPRFTSAAPRFGFYDSEGWVDFDPVYDCDQFCRILYAFHLTPGGIRTFRNQGDVAVNRGTGRELRPVAAPTFTLEPGFSECEWRFKILQGIAHCLQE